MGCCGVKPIGDPDCTTSDIINWSLLAGACAGFVAYVIAALLTSSLYNIGAIVLFTFISALTIAATYQQLCNWYDRLKIHDPKTITIQGKLLCAKRNTGFPYVAPFVDGDWTFNIGGDTKNEFKFLAPNDLQLCYGGTQLDEIRVRNPEPKSTPYNKIKDECSDVEAIHCEISSAMGTASVIGEFAGTVVASVVGIVLMFLYLGCAATLGIGCVLAIILAILAPLIGSYVGGLIGTAVGAIDDWYNDTGNVGKSIDVGKIVVASGTWVSDSGHLWNEIHDVESLFAVELKGSSNVNQNSAAVMIGRYPID